MNRLDQINLNKLLFFLNQNHTSLSRSCRRLKTNISYIMSSGLGIQTSIVV